MRIKYRLEDIDFEWDNEKYASNLRKHGLSFETACEVFLDPWLDTRGAGDVAGEEREAAIGLTLNWRLVYVVYVMREDRIRIISARLATPPERVRYEEELR